MKIKIISCWFSTSYGAYADSLRTAMERKTGNEVGVIASNCGCGDPVEVNRVFQNRKCDYFEFLNIPYYKSANQVKYWLRIQAQNWVYWLRAKRYMSKKEDAEVLHFQQTLNAYGANVVFNWLNLPTKSKRIVTVHELDPYQLDFPQKNSIYNKADHIIVIFEEMKKELVNLKVDPEKISVVPYGVTIGPMGNEKREGIIFYGGHKLNKTKGADSLFKAMAIIKKRLGAATPSLKIHGHWGKNPPYNGPGMADEFGISDKVVWLNQLSSDDAVDAYKKSLICVLPYKGSSAGFPAVTAMAYGTPVIATKRAGLPDHIGEAGIWVNEDAPEEIAARILEILDNPALRSETAAKGRARAERYFNWDKIAEMTLDVYKKTLS